MKSACSSAGIETGKFDFMFCLLKARWMKLTTRGHYSVKALLDLSLQPKYGPVSVK